MCSNYQIYFWIFSINLQNYDIKSNKVRCALFIPKITVSQQPRLRSLNHHLVNLLSPLYFTQMVFFHASDDKSVIKCFNRKYVLCQKLKSGVETVGRLKWSFKINVAFSNPKQLPFNTWTKPGDRLLVMSRFIMCLNDVWKSVTCVIVGLCHHPSELLIQTAFAV